MELEVKQALAANLKKQPSKEDLKPSDSDDLSITASELKAAKEVDVSDSEDQKYSEESFVAEVEISPRVIGMDRPFAGKPLGGAKVTSKRSEEYTDSEQPSDAESAKHT